MGQRSFSSLTPAGQRVRIAKDVIKQLKHGVVSSRRVYFRFETDDVIDMNEPLKAQLLSEGAPGCSACAIGALFVSSVILKNHVTPRQLGLSLRDNGLNADRRVITRRLRASGNFSSLQLCLIETAFEGMVIGDHRDLTAELTRRCEQFFNRYDNRNKRMAAIMQNVVDNRGEFRP